jgi:hypothetical protein
VNAQGAYEQRRRQETEGIWVAGVSKDEMLRRRVLRHFAEHEDVMNPQLLEWACLVDFWMPSAQEMVHRVMSDLEAEHLAIYTGLTLVTVPRSPGCPGWSFYQHTWHRVQEDRKAVRP